MATYSKKCSAVGGYSYATNFTLYIELTETDIDTTNNKSKIKYKVYCKSSGSGSINARHLKYFKLNGSTIINETVNVNVSSPNANIAIASGTTSAISHNSDGTKSVSFEAEIDAASYGVSASKSGTFTLSTIPRKSTVSASTANIGSNSTITIKRASSAFTHTLTYSFGSLSGTIATKTTSTSVSWTLPDSFYSQIPNAKSGTGTITCTTYNGNTSLGSNTCSFTANAVESVAKPTVVATITDINATTIALTGDSSKLVLNASTARVQVLATLNKSAGSISSVKINNTNVGSSTSITKDYSNVTARTFTIIVIDSRGFSTTTTISPSIINYVPLTLNAQVLRPSPTTGEVSLSYNGNYFNGNFGNENNTLTVSYQYKLTSDSTYTIGDVDITPTISGNTYSRNRTSLGMSFTYKNSYNFIVTVTDKIKSVSYSVVVSKGEPVFYWGEDFLKVNGHIYADQKVLWSGAMYMREDQIATLSEEVLKQNNGIVLVFSDYSNGEAHDWGFHEYFVPKQTVSLHNGAGHSILIPDTSYTYGVKATKYIYVQNTQLTGNANNVGSHGNLDNSSVVLRYVIGV